MLSRVENRRALQRGRRRNGSATLPDPSVPAGTDTLPQIQHIVILMMENHSYDNYLGMLQRGDGFPLNSEGQPAPTNTAADGTVIPLRRYPGTVQKPQVPSQSWHASHIQWGEGTCGGFVQSVEKIFQIGRAHV